ncbi:MAG TPA: sortase [Candidatus Limnocylindrales bacterium]
MAVSPARPVADRPTAPASIPQPQALLRARVAPAAAAPAATRARQAAPAHRGRNHVWIPSLGISRGLTWFSCSRSTPPGNRLYQWGCAGRNNIYVFAHAATVFRPLHDAYVSGRLQKGMKVVYADGRGRIHIYRVRYWRVVSPVGADWAYAAQSRPSMTLQTCVGARSQYRLVVRLTAV